MSWEAGNCKVCNYIRIRMVEKEKERGTGI